MQLHPLLACREAACDGGWIGGFEGEFGFISVPLAHHPPGLLQGCPHVRCAPYRCVAVAGGVVEVPQSGPAVHDFERAEYWGELSQLRGPSRIVVRIGEMRLNVLDTVRDPPAGLVPVSCFTEAWLPEVQGRASGDVAVRSCFGDPPEVVGYARCCVFVAVLVGKGALRALKRFVGMGGDPR